MSLELFVVNCSSKKYVKESALPNCIVCLTSRISYFSKQSIDSLDLLFRSF
jgi:hypothetical protein